MKLMDKPAQKMLRMLASGLDLILTGYFCQLSFSFLHFNPIDSKLALPDSFLEGEKRTLQKISGDFCAWQLVFKMYLLFILEVYAQMHSNWDSWIAFLLKLPKMIITKWHEISFFHVIIFWVYGMEEAAFAFHLCFFSILQLADLSPTQRSGFH